MNFSQKNLRPSENKNQLIRHTKLNPLYVLGAVVTLF